MRVSQDLSVALVTPCFIVRKTLKHLTFEDFFIKQHVYAEQGGEKKAILHDWEMKKKKVLSVEN